MTQIVVIDLETYYSRDFSLSKISTEAYVRSSQFEPIGLSLKINGAPGVWYPKPEVNDLLRDTDWSDSFIICQNTAFDGAILNWRYGVNPKGWMDTLGMSRALYPHEKSHSLAAQATRHGIGQKGNEVINALGKHYDDFGTHDLDMYAQYCINDGELTYKLFKLYMSMGFPRQELELIDLTLRMFIEPALVLDKGLLETHLGEVKARKLTLLEDVRDMMLKDADPDFVYTVFSEGTEGIKKLLMSNEKFAEVLRRFHVEPPMKKSPITGKEAYAFAKTDEGFTALAEHENFDVQGLVAARLGTKTTIEESRTERFIEMADRGAFPVPLRYYGAATGRWSGQDKVNLQNLPSRGQNAGRIKKSMLAPPGYVVIDCDSAQIEARVLAWLAGQDDLVAAFERKEDVYKLMATYIYNVPIEGVTKAQRTVGKTVVLGAGYGVGHGKLQLFLKTQAGVDVTLDEAKRIVDTYRATYPKIPALWRKCEAALKSMSMGMAMVVDAPGIITSIATGGFMLPNGLTIQYPDLKRIIMRDKKTDEDKTQWRYISKGVPVHVYGAKSCENLCQAVARIVIGEQMLRIAKRYKVVLTVHDAVCVVAKQEEAAEAVAYVEACMSWRPKWAQALPLACESGTGASYGDC